MAKQDYTIAFLDGSSTGSLTLPVGTYTFVSTNITGYEVGGSVASFDVTPTTTSVPLSITADGTMTVTVEDDIGTLITSGDLFFSDDTGAVQYGAAETIDAGVATFTNVPYSTASPITCYIMQDGSDGDHDPITTPVTETMGAATETDTVLNDRKTTTMTFTLADANYDGFTPETGNVVVNG